MFTPEHPGLYTLNASAWLVLELCDGRTLAAIEANYRDAVGATAEQAAIAAEVHAIVAYLAGNGIVTHHQAPAAQHAPA